MNLRNGIRKDIVRSVGRWLGGSVGDLEQKVEVFRSVKADHGDYTSNVAFRLATSNKQQAISNEAQLYHSPMEFAKKLADSLKNQPYVRKLEVKEPGFLNFFIKEEVLAREVENVLKRDKFESKFFGKKIVVEFTDPNPFKEFHVGHLFSNSVGEAISRMLEVVGAQVMRANYQGDVGLHVAKCVWGIRNNIKNQKSKIKDLKKKSLQERINFLGSAYAEGASAYETDSKAKEEIIKLNKEIYEHLDQIEEYKLGKAWSLENFEAIYKRLGTKFDFYYFESEVGQEGLKIVRDNLQKGVFEESQGAIIFPGEKHHLHNRVFITGQALPTYEAKELGLAFRKYEDFAYDLSIIVTGNEIVDYFRVLIMAIEQVDPKLAAKTLHIAHGMLRMPGGKVSSRLGNVISAQSLLDEAKKRALKLAAEKKIAKDVDVESVAEKVAVGAVKYALLKGNANQDIKFSFDEAMALEGNSGPYLQYTYARCRSVIEKSKRVKELRVKSQKGDFSSLAGEEELLLRSLGHFEETVVAAAEDFAPNQVASFLFEIAQKYNNLYNNLRIVDSKEPERSRRLFLTEATAKVLKKSLFLLGIEALL